MYEREQIATYGQGLMLYITKNADALYYGGVPLTKNTDSVTPTTLGLTRLGLGIPTLTTGRACGTGSAISSPLSAYNTTPPRCNSTNVTCTSDDQIGGYVKVNLTYDHRRFLLPAGFLPRISSQFIVKINWFLQLGQSSEMLAEFALVLVPMIFLTLGSVDLGMITWSKISMDRSVNAVARCVAVDPCLTKCSNIQTYGTSLAKTIYPITFTQGLSTCGVSINATMTYRFLILPFADSALSSSACYPQQTGFKCNSS
jgi:hypothetical protein